MRIVGGSWEIERVVFLGRGYEGFRIEGEVWRVWKIDKRINSDLGREVEENRRDCIGKIMIIWKYGDFFGDVWY